MQKVISFVIENIIGLGILALLSGNLMGLFRDNPIALPFYASIIFWRAMEQFLVGTPYVSSKDVAERHDDRLSLFIINMVIWVILVVSLVDFTHGSGHRFPFAIQCLGVGLTLGGATIRYLAIRELGRFFTFDLIIRRDHKVVTSGIYRLIRHPAYFGAMVLSFGLPTALSSWYGLAAALLIGIPARLHRINHEDQVLAEKLGGEYRDYCLRVKKLIPYVY
jgi:protein-S-isoprenylcysteine O-methyltransferase Ste14